MACTQINTQAVVNDIESLLRDTANFSLFLVVSLNENENIFHTYTIPHCSGVMADSKLHLMCFRFFKAFVTLVALETFFQERLIS